jgi:hypothetical protein
MFCYPILGSIPSKNFFQSGSRGFVFPSMDLRNERVHAGPQSPTKDRHAVVEVLGRGSGNSGPRVGKIPAERLQGNAMNTETHS